MVVNCEQVWREVSNYVDGEVDSSLRSAIEEHARGCRRCAAVLEGTRNVVQLYSDERMLEVPLGFGHRLERRVSQQRLQEIRGNRRTFLGWIAAAATACLVVGSFEVARSSAFRDPQLRSHLARPGIGVPPDMPVIAVDEGRLFHIAGCTFLHDKKARLRTLTAGEAAREGYTPCIRCLKKYMFTA